MFTIVKGKSVILKKEGKNRRRMKRDVDAGGGGRSLTMQGTAQRERGKRRSNEVGIGLRHFIFPRGISDIKIPEMR